MSNIDQPEDSALFDVPFVFRRRPVSIPGDLRTTWKIALIVLLLDKCCIKNSSSLTKLHVLNWAIRVERNSKALSDALVGQTPPDALLIRFEPSLNRAIDLGLADGLFKRINGGKILLSPEKGAPYASEIENEEDVLKSEKVFANSIGKKVSEKFINQIFAVRS